MQISEQDLQLLEKVRQSVSKELLYLRNRSYAYASIYLAWKALQNSDRSQAMYFRNQAIALHPQLNYSLDCLSLNVAIVIMQYLRTNDFTRFLALTSTLYQRIISIKKWFRNCTKL